jgi:hypothetical protein
MSASSVLPNATLLPQDDAHSAASMGLSSKESREKVIKKFLIATALIVVAGSSFAGSVSPAPLARAPDVSLDSLKYDKPFIHKECVDHATEIMKKLKIERLSTTVSGAQGHTPTSPSSTIMINCNSTNTIVFFVVAGDDNGNDETMQLLRMVTDIWQGNVPTWKDKK